MRERKINAPVPVNERPFLKRAGKWVEKAERQNRPFLTHFLNPEEVRLVAGLVNRYPQLQFDSWGGFSGTELQRVIISPDYFRVHQDDYQVQVIEIQYAKDFYQLTHCQIMGVLMNSGIKPEVLGDIYSDGSTWQFVCQDTVTDYLIQNTNRVGNASVELTRVAPENVVRKSNDWEPAFKVVPSVRLDVLLASAFNLSRAVAKKLVQAGQVKVNWFLYEEPNYLVKISDILSVRGYGRLRLKQLNGQSKRGKIKCELEIIKNK